MAISKKLRVSKFQAEEIEWVDGMPRTTAPACESYGLGAALDQAAAGDPCLIIRRRR